MKSKWLMGDYEAVLKKHTISSCIETQIFKLFFKKGHISEIDGPTHASC